MKGRLWWSSVMPLTAALCLTFATSNVASAQSGPRIVGSGPEGSFDYSPLSSARRPGLIDPSCGLIGGNAVQSSACDSQSGREWEGISSTDYFTFEPSVYSPPNPDIAVGPDDILTVVNRTIARYPNPNAPSATNPTGVNPVTYNPAGTFFFPPTSRNFLDVWMGEGIMTELCPTQPRSNASCVIDNASVRYDQMQGRFVVLFTVVDTGLINCDGCFGLPVAGSAASILTRKASWVLVSSRWATGCQGTVASGPVNIGTSCTPNLTPAVPGLTGNTEFFTTPQPPGPSQNNANSGGLNGNWIAIYGATDGSCGVGGTASAPTGACPFGNINSISDVRRGFTFTGALTLDCTNTALGNTTRLCYFPSSARLGLDNDNITIVSSVYNDNVQIELRGWGTLAQPGINPWEGTRLRVWKKAAVYTGLTSLATCPTAGTYCAGASQAPLAITPLAQMQGDYYDLWDQSQATPYTTDILVTQALPGGGTRTVPGLNYEPEHVRGRALASYTGNMNLDNAFSSIWGAVTQGATVTSTFGGGNPPQTVLYHRPITYSRVVAGTLGANVSSIPATVNLPLLVGGIPTLQALQNHVVPQFFNPDAVVQRAKLNQVGSGNNVGPTPFIYVGDDRPHRVISREGERYIARVATLPNFATFNPGVTSNSTVTYDIVQKLLPMGAGGAASEVYNTQWGNGNFYAPMHDTPANVVQYGSISPINIQPFLEKLFVGTTFPPLAPTDPRTFNYGLISGQALQACKGQEPSLTTAAMAYPGLFDIRCGEDAYDAYQSYRNPVTGAFTPSDFQVNRVQVNGTSTTAPTFAQCLATPGLCQSLAPFGIRGGAATDPNTLAAWYYGAYAKARLSSVLGFGQWGTYIAHYPLTFPTRDPYNNLTSTYPDVQQLLTDCSTGTCNIVQPPTPNLLFPYVQIAKQTEIQPGARTDTGVFNVNGTVSRAEMARWTVRAQSDETAISAYLNSTGGIFCSFADVACPGASGGVVANTTGVTGDWRYIETMYRRGYTKGCEQTNDGQRRFCPTRTLTRGEMSVFIVRAKMNSVFPTVTSGAFTTTSCQPPGTQVTQIGDQFGLFVGCNPYFTDVPTTHVYYAFIQKMRELRISNGTAFSPATYSPDATLTRGQLMTFLVRGFFP